MLRLPSKEELINDIEGGYNRFIAKDMYALARYNYFYDKFKKFKKDAIAMELALIIIKSFNNYGKIDAIYNHLNTILTKQQLVKYICSIYALDAYNETPFDKEE